MGELKKIPRVLYKYIPSRFVDSFCDEGNILFRNLTYFKKIEDGDVRGDHLEGTHRDFGKNGAGIDITINKNGKKLKGDYFDNSIETDDKTFIFCLSNIYDEKLFDEFECDACIKITNTKEFISLCERKLLVSTGKHSKLHYNNIKYYELNEDMSEYIKIPIMIPILKREKYRIQDEFRLYFAVDNAFKIKKSITIKNSNSVKSPPDKIPKIDEVIKEKLLTLGNIRPITEVFYKK